jgi:lipoprotein-releasing system ATP-binding protein
VAPQLPVTPGPVPRDERLAVDPESTGDARQASCQLACQGLKKSYRKGQVIIPVLRGVDFQVQPGEFVAIVGQSGCGKSTLLHLLATLDQADAGEIRFLGQRIDNLSPTRRDALRNCEFGMVFQFYHLLPELTTLENVLLPYMISCGAWRYWRQKRHLRKQAMDMLEMVQLAGRVRHRPRELSGGEMQRAAIARALVHGPKLLLADEPTGNLDPRTGAGIIRILRSLNTHRNLTIVMVTHDQAIAAEADRVVRLSEGRVECA